MLAFPTLFLGRVGVLLHLTLKLQTSDPGSTVERDSLKTVASRFRLRTDTLNAEFTHGIRGREWPILLSGMVDDHEATRASSWGGRFSEYLLLVVRYTDSTVFFTGAPPQATCANFRKMVDVGFAQSGGGDVRFC